MTGNLHRVLARERARGEQDGKQHFINHFSSADNFAELNRVRRRGGRFERIFAGGQKTFVGDGERLRAGNADDGQSAFTERRCNGGDGVIKHNQGCGMFCNGNGKLVIPATALANSRADSLSEQENNRMGFAFFADKAEAAQNQRLLNALLLRSHVNLMALISDTRRTFNLTGTPNQVLPLKNCSLVASR